MKLKSKFAEVALPLPIDQTFTYLIPDEMMDFIQIGIRVLVPFVSRKLTGFVVDLNTITSIKNIKTIEDILDDTPVISTELLRLARWISQYYICPLGEVLKAMIPRGMNFEIKTIVSLRTNDYSLYLQSEDKLSKNQKEILQILIQEKKIDLQQLRKRPGISNPSFSLSRLEKLELITRELILQSPKAKPKFEKWLKLSKLILQSGKFEQIIEQIEKEAPKRALCLKLLSQEKEISQKKLLKIARTNTTSITALYNEGLIERFEKEVIRDYYRGFYFSKFKKIFLNSAQIKAITEIDKAIQSEFFNTFLLYGVTGSGKTQIYIEILKRTLSKGRTAIVLVPEISLTPQTVSRFTANFPNLVAVLHSRMSIGERFDSWRKLKEGKFKIAIGARSAVFAPLKNIGLIVVDEEQESTYKQHDSQPLYHARDVAIMRGKLNEAVVILGSATPSIETFYNAKIQKYQLLDLPNRVDNIPLPDVTIVDMHKQKKHHVKNSLEIFSRPLQNKIQEKLKLSQQIILLQNRRGFSTFVKCRDCGYIEKCKNCNITLTYHITTHRLRCHYCDYIKKAPEVCPNCNSSEILFRGIGTQQVESELRRLFPDVRIVRMDLDTTAQKLSHDRILKAFEEQKYDILLGTQMIAKGHDFERVTLVGIVSADTSLFLPDFRASEKTFQLVTQVAGRAGRKNLKGEVIIQTYSPDNYGLQCAKTHDFIKFFSSEIQQRKEINYPPFSRLVQVLVKGKNEQQVILVIDGFKNALPTNTTIFQILGPVPSPLSKIKNYYRWHFILKVNKNLDPSGKLTNNMIREAENKIKKNIKNDTIKIIINVDPISLL